MKMVGSIAPNFHEGSRSEYLAQYIFASFGTAVSVPHQEDSGIDLYCTLTERVSRRAWVRGYFSVQVKSTMDSWTLDGEDSVQWLVQHPLPFFFCVVDKRSASLRLYHTSPRFYVWSVLPLPTLLALVPTADREGRCTQWEGGTAFSLSAPVLDVSVEKLLDDEFHRQAWEILDFWIGVDLENLARIKAGIHSFKMPDQYRTNDTAHCAWVTQGATKAPDLTGAMEHLKECLAYLSSQLHRRSDLGGAARCALLLRHFFKDDISGGTHDPFLHSAINKVVGGDHDHLFRGVDSLNALLDEKLSHGTTHEAERTTAG